MKQNNCILCDVSITRANDSNEHIIPNAIGGKKVIRGYVCKDCNSSSGYSWDAELAAQLNPLCVLLNIRRSRGSVPPMSVVSSGGQKLIVGADGNISVPMHVTQQRDGNRMQMQIRAKSRTQLRQKLEEIERKYPQVDAEQALEQVIETSGYMHEVMQMELSLGGEVAGQSIVKSAMALVADAGICVQECELACQFLRGDGDECFGFYNEKEFIRNRPEGMFFHCIHVQGDPRSMKVLAYAEYFGFLRIVMCLSDNYIGRQFSRTYAIDPVAGKNLDLNVALQLTRRDIDLAYAGKKVNWELTKEAIGKLVAFYQRTAFERERRSVIEEAVEYAFENCGAKPGEELTEEKLNLLSGLVFEKMEPFLLRVIQGNRRIRNLSRSE